MPGEGVRDFEQFAFAAPHHFDAGQGQLPRGEGAGFVQGDHIDQREIFDRRPAAEENAPPGARRNGGEDGRGDGKHESAGRGHDQ